MTTEEELLRSFEVNVLQALLVRDLADPLSRSAGAIVNVGTVHSVATSANVFPYSFSKSALLGFTRSVAIEMAAEQVPAMPFCSGRSTLRCCATDLQDANTRTGQMAIGAI